MKLNKRSGISLIVLVITIIVMIILAAAIILSLSGSGVIGKANKAQKDTDTANMLEAAGVAYAEYELEKQMGELNPANQTAETYVRAKLANQFDAGTLEHLSILDDGTIQILPTIPTGFVMSPYAGEQKISEGLVIYEATAADLEGKTNLQAMETYNQYVWVPVEGKFERIAWYNEDLTNKYVEPLREGLDNMDDISYYSAEIAQYYAMKTSVEKNGGFYIARYETGIETGLSVSSVSKKGAKVYNTTKWDHSWTTSTGGYGVDTNGGVAKVSKKSYENSERHLIYGVQWDAAVNFMKDVPNPTVPGKKYIEDATGMGWNNGNYNDATNGNADHKTGIDVGGAENAYNKVKNIYDMAGNVVEWTYEVYTGSGYGKRVMRGGSYKGSGVPASFRNSSTPANADDYIGYRFVLYIK